MNAAERWLEQRLDGVPPTLAAAVRECVGRVSGPVEPEEIPGVLAEAALHELDSALGQPQGRRSALRLLAVDASLTYAFEAAADLGTDARALAERLGLKGELGMRLRAVCREGAEARADSESESRSASAGAE
jgi:hypothetical protein